MDYTTDDDIDYWNLGLPFLREYYTMFNMTEPSITFYKAVPSRIDPDNSASIRRWIIITLFVFTLIVLTVTTYVIYSMYCKNPHRNLNTQIRNIAPA